MTIIATLQKLNEMKFFGMERALRTTMETGKIHDLTQDEIIAFMVESEYFDRENRRLQRRLKAAKFRYSANVEGIDFTVDRELDKNLFMQLSQCNFIKRKENIIITGSTGAGKSYIASAIGNQACQLGYKVIYYNTGKLFTRLKMLKVDNSHIKEIEKIAKHDLLILDDFGLQPLDGESRLALLEIMEDRHGEKSTLISTQIPVETWHDLIGESTIADAIMDRLVYSSHRLELDGDSLRKLYQLNMEKI